MAEALKSMPYEPRWHWRNTRGIYLGFGVRPLTWRRSLVKETDVYCWSISASFGPFGFAFLVDHGNCSSENRFDAWLGLSEIETYARALKYEGRVDD
jgi:hypothetical protein